MNIFQARLIAIETCYNGCEFIIIGKKSSLTCKWVDALDGYFKIINPEVNNKIFRFEDFLTSEIKIIPLKYEKKKSII